MAAPARALNPFHTSTNHSQVTFITSLLQTLNPQTPNPSNLSSAPLNQFSPHLNPTLVIQVLHNQTNPYHALFFFKWASNPDHNPNNYSHTFKCYSAITDILLSHSLFSSASSLLQESNHLSDFLIGKFITAHGRRRGVRAAINWFHKAKVIENGRCLFSYNAILGVLVRANRIGLAESIYDQIFKEGLVKPDASTYTIMIRGFCKVGEIENAQKVFDEMTCEPNLITYNTMIHGFCKKGEVDSARRVLGQMMEGKDCLPDTVTYTTLIDGYSKKGELGEAMKCMDEMVKQACEPNVLTYNAVIHGFCLSGNVNEAKRMMTRMRLNGVKDDIATHTSILKGLCIAGKADEAVEHLKEMARLGMKLDVKAYGIVVNEYCKRKEPDGAILLLMEMRMRGLKPSVSSFNAVLSVLLENGELERAINLVKQMPQMDCFPNFFSYNSVICSLCNVRGRMGEVEGLIHDMLRNGHALDATLCSCLVKGYSEDGDLRSAMQVFCDALDQRYIISLESFSVFVKELCAKGKAVEAERMFEDMCKRCSVVHIDIYRKVLDDYV
ncbi:putative tetratricopeptide-like helical domain-containing protein [Rosa chinensis]|uniref:Putative tetratricopeptide-like helical domain-containing protein n=1 Tax=Rosa chinensis TaxID=74649 RepID=A0A2P6Q1H1_ROSCH|nr:pentatricopeptide repeat-containing protein At4g11690 [Rosa chinensis]XP_040363952.1 pentatricopeptide repeat-containing protein At4g11690 [Rosa chinensis]PRQ28017.1 putative tetratricopeptide-like helical domain-containing protein [Rosa chinensis]